MDKVAAKYANDHKYPITKFELPGTKLFLKADEEFVEERLKKLETVIRHARVERRCDRILAEYTSDPSTIIIKRFVGSILSQMGYQNKNGKFLFPEEALFLIETNRLELTQNGRTLSIREAYESLLKNDVDFKTYRVYKTLVSQGYRLIRKSRLNQYTKLELPSKHNKEDKNPNDNESIKNVKKRRSKEDSNVENKKLKTDQISVPAGDSNGPGTSEEPDHFEDLTYVDECDIDQSSVTSKYNTEEILRIFESIRENAPKAGHMEPSICEPQYCIFLPNNSSKQMPDFNLFISDGKIPDTLNEHEEIPNIYAICSGDSISFYSFSHINLPNL